MITVRLLGGAARALGADSLEIASSETTVAGVMEELASRARPGSPALDPRSVLVAVNGADSSALGGPAAPVRGGDIVSVIPVVHGGAAPRRAVARAARPRAELFWVRGGGGGAGARLAGLRSEFPGLAIQAFDAGRVLGAGHIGRILAVSLEARRRGALLADRLETDLLLRVAGTRQIDRAVREAGARPGRPAVLAAAGRAAQISRLRARLAPDLSDPAPARPRAAARLYGVSAAHAAAAGSLEDVLAERAATVL